MITANDYPTPRSTQIGCAFMVVFFLAIVAFIVWILVGGMS